ncbi:MULTISPECIES: 3-hydroxyisobutyrate dehydrogenase [Microbacterium]|uniref:3-hydroxyisobutyrate dehydrogenase n=1 Tax=Microbacterium wangchenii TaxID=2541726 RepID=A0ABX5SYP2_9MICO|nr:MULTISPECIES: 3-hydroxyisobutyrate dehydrogenase [Microbacterium]MCK6065908.1 3-hydroxyisobutyrate dehydrogenase [Microbacterium sp. EYE_512]QBR90208.1 3-hydroxyisobutyrate dehydrogenase [Microbacterium wangchenii]TXK11777.1 3-hydroxyisobutyrate dehydrogenase [Microbacterium wangchenii]
MRIAFLGLGHMGLPMARNLASAGHEVVVFDVVPAALDAGREAGLPAAASGAEAAASADVVITMFPEGRHVLAAYRGSEDSAGLLQSARPGTLFVDCSTIAVDDARAAHALAEAAGHRSLDAPVSGGVVGAENATLAFMVGGDEADLEEARPLLERMGRRIVHCGGPGLGQAAKVCNNMILGVSQIVVAEAFVLGERLGLSHEALFEVAANASGQCWALTTNCPVPGPVPTSPANNDYRPGFAGALMAKDLGLAAHAIARTGVDAQMGLLAQALYAQFAEGPGAGQDFSGIIHTIRSGEAA